MRGTAIHYEATGDYDIIDVCNHYDLNFNRGNVIKGAMRAWWAMRRSDQDPLIRSPRTSAHKIPIHGRLEGRARFARCFGPDYADRVI